MASAQAPTPPTLLPVTNPAGCGGSAPSSGAGLSDAPLATPAFRLFLGRLSDTARRSLADRRPWTELLDRTAFSRPDSLSEATSRLRRNLGYFRVNYAAVVAFSLAASLLAHPFSLLVLLGILGAWCFLYVFRASDQPVVLFGRSFTDRETLLGLVIASVLAFFMTSVASLIISGLLVGGAIVSVHGAFRMPEDLFLDDPSTGSNGNPTNRPPGRKQSKGKGTSSTCSPMVEVMSELKTEMKSMFEKKAAVMESMVASDDEFKKIQLQFLELEKNKEDRKKALAELEKNKEDRKKTSEEDRIMLMDTSTLIGVQRAYWEDRQKEILDKRRKRSSN